MAIDTLGANALASNSVTSAKIVDGAIAVADVADGSITTAKVADDAVTSAKLDTNISIGGTFGVTGASTFTGGIANTGTITAGTLGNNMVMPAGVCVQTTANQGTDTLNISASGTSGNMTAWTDVGMVLGSITPKKANNKLVVIMQCPWVGMANASGTAEIQLQYYASVGGAAYSAFGNHQGGAYIANNTYISTTLLEETSFNTTSTINFKLYMRGRYSTVGDYSFNRGSNQYWTSQIMEFMV